MYQIVVRRMARRVRLAIKAREKLRRRRMIQRIKGLNRRAMMYGGGLRNGMAAPGSRERDSMRASVQCVIVVESGARWAAKGEEISSIIN